MKKNIYTWFLTLISSLCLLCIIIKIVLSGYILNVENYLDICRQFNLIQIADERIQQALDYEMGVENLPLSLVQGLVPRDDIEIGFFNRIENVIGYVKGDTVGIAPYDPEPYVWKFSKAFDDYLNQLPYQVSDSKINEVMSNVNAVIYNETRANMHQIDFNFLQYSSSLKPIIQFIQGLNHYVIFGGIILIALSSLYGIYLLNNHIIIDSFYYLGIALMINATFFKVITWYLQQYNLNFNIMRIHELNDAINYFVQGLLEFINHISVISLLLGLLLIIFKRNNLFVKKSY